MRQHFTTWIALPSNETSSVPIFSSHGFARSGSVHHEPIYKGTDYDYWYDLWLNSSCGSPLLKKLIATVQANPRFTLVKRTNI